MTYIGSLSGGYSGGGSSASGINQMLYTPGSGLSGLASGIDTDSMVNAMVQAAQVPLVQLLQQRQIVQWQEMRYQQVNASLSDLQNSVQALKLQSIFMAHTVNSSNTSVVTGTASTLAPNGTYNITVGQLATGVTVYSSSPLSTNPVDPNYANKTTMSQIDPTDFSSSSATVTLNINGQSFTVYGSDTIQTVLSEISSNTASGVSAFYDTNTGNVVMQTTTTGQSAKIQVDSTTAQVLSRAFKIAVDPANPPQGQNASVTINGYTTSSQTNQLNYNGLTLNLYATGTSTVTVSTDVDSIVNTITNFVQQYNRNLQLMQGLYNEQRNYDYPPLTQQQASQMTEDQIEKWYQKAQSGMLANDPLLGTIMSKLEDDVQYGQLTGQTSSTVNGQSVTLDSLAAIGITPIDPLNGVSSGAIAPGVTTTGWNTYGLLQINTDQLRAAIQADPQAVMRLFTNNPQLPGTPSGMGTGVAVQLYNDLTNAIQQLTDEAGSNPNVTSEIVTKTSSGATITGAGLMPYTPIDPNADFTTLFAADPLDVSFLGQQISGMDTNAENMQQQISDLRQRYLDEFSQMEQALAQLSSQSGFLTSLMSSSSQGG